MSELNDHQQDVLERAEQRRRAVVAAAKELVALGCGCPFVDPIEPPEPDHASRRDRIEELVDEIMERTSVNVHHERLDPSYRYSWTAYPVDVFGGQLVVNTPEGPACVTRGVASFALQDIGAADPKPWPEVEQEAEERYEAEQRARHRMLDGLTHLVKDGDTEGLAEAWRLLEEEIAEALEGWDPTEAVPEERARDAAARVFHHLDTATMLRISYAMARRAIPWTSSSAAALEAGVNALDVLWQKGGLEEDVYIDTPHGRVGVRSELERLHEAAEEWEEAGDG